MFENLSRFIEAFNNRNTFNDEKLNGLVEQAKGIVTAVGGKDLADAATRMRDSEGLREQTAKAFQAIKAEVDKTIETLPGRSFDFSEQD